MEQTRDVSIFVDAAKGKTVVQVRIKSFCVIVTCLGVGNGALGNLECSLPGYEAV
jgi:hypothetical protein